MRKAWLAKHSAEKRIGRFATVKQAALYLGCSDRLILQLKGRRWLKSVATIEKIRSPGFAEVFYIHSLDAVAWDMAYALSFYDIAAIRKSKMELGALSVRRGIPVKVIQIVLENPIFGLAVEIVRLYNGARQRPAQGLDIALRRNNDKPLARIVKALLSPYSANSRRASTSPSERLCFEDASAPAGILGFYAGHIFGRSGAASGSIGGVEAPLEAETVSEVLEQDKSLE
jgi:hypothetical protein